MKDSLGNITRNKSYDNYLNRLLLPLQQNNDLFESEKFKQINQVSYRTDS